MNVKFVKVESAEIVDVRSASFCSDFRSIFSASNISDSIWDCINDISEKIIRYTLNGSGYILQKIKEIEVNSARFSPVVKYLGGSYIPLPDCLIRKNGLINIRNNDHLFYLVRCTTFACNNYK